MIIILYSLAEDLAMPKINRTMTYGAMHLVVAMLVAYAVTGSLAAAFAIGLIEPAVQTVAYHFHEKAWNGSTSATNLAAK
ncbi:MAG: DUF2061 domain-containing protein [Henriciella sp.]|jgi:uncharacterized membrane protein